MWTLTDRETSSCLQLGRVLLILGPSTGNTTVQSQSKLWHFGPPLLMMIADRTGVRYVR